ncbi:MAG: radical SAM protein [Bacteroidales bacterium]|nr:radical SAM protein [Bacteroidales bacterium]
MSILFHEVVFGPVHSRRLGVSLGINLLPVDTKYCTFNCVYCECGWSHEAVGRSNKLPTRETVKTKLEEKLAAMKASGLRPDAITFAGNGEPTIHPQFPGILDDTIALRDKYFPDAQVSVLTNSSTLDNPAIFEALKRTGNSILKLDAGTEKMFRLINSPRSGITLKHIVEKLKEFEGQLIIQTLFIRGEKDGKKFDNTTGPEFMRWLKHVKSINPKYVMIYPIDRETPIHTLEKVSFDELRAIAARVEAEGIKTQVYY